VLPSVNTPHRATHRHAWSSTPATTSAPGQVLTRPYSLRTDVPTLAARSMATPATPVSCWPTQSRVTGYCPRPLARPPTTTPLFSQATWPISRRASPGSRSDSYNPDLRATFPHIWASREQPAADSRLWAFDPLRKPAMSWPCPFPGTDYTYPRRTTEQQKAPRGLPGPRRRPGRAKRPGKSMIAYCPPTGNWGGRFAVWWGYLGRIEALPGIKDP
jgi:hypothetical protein